jgi:SRSO17 transposase
MITTSKTYTPELTPEVLDRLEQYADVFRDDFSPKKQAIWSRIHLQGLLHDGERTSIEPLSGRVTLPPGLDAKDTEQALQPFVNQSPWDDQVLAKRYRRHMAETFASPEGIFVFDDTSSPKQGKHSVGVQRQYCGALGKEANCQVAPSVHYVSPEGHSPLAMRLFLPESWARDETRLDEAGGPQEFRRAKAKGAIALELLDTVRGEGLPGWLALADAGYGASEDFRMGLAARGLDYIVGVTDAMVVLAEEPTWERPGPAESPEGTGGRPRERPRWAEYAPRPVSLKALAAETPPRKVAWREGTKGKLSGHFAWLRVGPGGGWATGECAGAEPIWLLIERQADGKLKYAFSNGSSGVPGR